MKVSQLRSLIKESIKEVLSESNGQARWDSMSEPEKETALYSVIKNPSEAESYINATWDELPDVVTAYLERVNERANMRAKRLKENAERPVPGLYKLEAHLKFWASEFLKDFASEDEMLIDFPKYDAQFQALDHDSKLYKLYNMLYDACQNEANNYGKQSSSRRQAIARRILTELPKSNV